MKNEILGLKKAELSRLKDYSIQEEIISHKERRKRDTSDITGSENDIRFDDHQSIFVKINEKEEILDLIQKQPASHALEAKCKFFKGKIRKMFINRPPAIH